MARISGERLRRIVEVAEHFLGDDGLWTPNMQERVDMSHDLLDARAQLDEARKALERVCEVAPDDACPGCQGGSDSYADALSAARAALAKISDWPKQI